MSDYGTIQCLFIRDILIVRGVIESSNDLNYNDYAFYFYFHFIFHSCNQHFLDILCYLLSKVVCGLVVELLPVVQWVIGLILLGGPIELFFVLASAPQLAQQWLS